MERNRIIMNPRIFLKNCPDHKNVHCMVRIDDANLFMRSIVQENKDAVKAVYQSRHGKESVIYVKSTKLLFLRDFELVEEIEWESHNVIFPWEWNGREEFLSDLPDVEPEKSPPLQENLTAHPDFEITEDVKTLLYWLKVNVRLRDVPLMKVTGLDYRKIKTLRDTILANSIVYVPTFLQGGNRYDCIYFSFFTKHYTFFETLFAQNSGTSFLIHGKNRRTILFVNTTRPSWVLRSMEYFEDIGIIHKMLFYYLQRRWDPIIEDLLLGKIPEKYFWMFGSPGEKK
ncbi:MAG: hypothetical protein AYK19_02555 [Theionarchaea archaeon DG-70-1]|nr:MAG: hypothetical protein AYK19_02555 [Theionarchaea archaeon DG-70-1]